MSLQVLDDLTNTKGDMNRECIGQGVANFVSGFFQTIGGDAMIGQSIINIQSGSYSLRIFFTFSHPGARGRLSSFVAAVLLFLAVIVLSPAIELIPVAALVR